MNKEVKGTYPGVSIGAGIFAIMMGILFFLDSWSRYNNPLFPFASQDVQQSIMIELLVGFFGIITGIAFMIKGFIDYMKQKS